MTENIVIFMKRNFIKMDIWTEVLLCLDIATCGRVCSFVLWKMEEINEMVNLLSQYSMNHDHPLKSTVN